MPGADRASAWLARGFVAILTLYQTIELCLPRWLREDWHAGDMAQHVWWTARFADPSLFPGDFIADFFSLPLFAPPGHQALYRLGVRFADPQTVAETLPFVLGPLLVLLCWRLGRTASGGSRVGAFVGACLGVRLMDYVDPGLPRGFALPLLALAMVGLLERRLLLVGLAGLGAALVYPPIAINVGATAAVVLGVELARSRRLPAGWPGLAACGAAAVVLVAGVYARPLPEGIGPRVTGAEARAMPEFQAEGRAALFEESAVETFFGRGRGGYGLRLHQGAALFAAVLLSALWLPGAVPLAAWALLGTGMLAHALAHATLFSLHLPARYMVYALPVFVVLWLSALAAPLAARARARLLWLGRPAPLAAALALFLAVDGGASLAHAWERAHRDTNLDKEATLAYLATLPPDALVASHPEDATSIPLRTRRSVLASTEVALPYHLGYYRRVAERLEASLVAFYADGWQDVDALHERYGADVMAVFRGRFARDERDVSEPFATRLAGVLSREPRRCVLLRPPPERILFQAGPWLVVRLGPPRPGYETTAGGRPPSQASPSAAGTR